MGSNEAKHLVSAIVTKEGKFSVAFHLDGKWKEFGMPFDTFDEAEAKAKEKGDEAHGENRYVSMR